MKSLLSRVEEESFNYATPEHAALDHLKMALAHLFEETEGRDVDNWLSEFEITYNIIPLWLKPLVTLQSPLSHY